MPLIRFPPREHNGQDFHPVLPSRRFASAHQGHGSSFSSSEQPTWDQLLMLRTMGDVLQFSVWFPSDSDTQLC